MKLTIIGASAGLGLETLKRALKRGHEVTTLSRSEIKWEDIAAFDSVRGDALNKTDLKKAIAHADAVLVTIGTGKNMKATTLFSDFAKVVLEI